MSGLTDTFRDLLRGGLPDVLDLPSTQPTGNPQAGVIPASFPEQTPPAPPGGTSGVFSGAGGLFAANVLLKVAAVGVGLLAVYLIARR